MNGNKFEIIGRLNHIEWKYLESGMCILRLLLSKKVKDDEYESFAVTLFNDSAQACEHFEKGNYVYATGKMQVNKFTDKNGNKREELRLVGFEAKVVKYDEASRAYVELNATPEVEKKPWEV